MSVIAVNSIGSFGIEISGLEASSLRDCDLQEQLVKLWDDHDLLVFRNMDFNSGEFVEFCQLFGKLEKNYFFFQGESEKYPQIARVIKEAGEVLNTGGIWHHDQAYYARPVKGIALYAVDIPSKGGDTLFTSASLAFDTLSPTLQETLKSLNVVHSTQLMLNKKKQFSGSQASRVSSVLEAMPLETAIHPAVCVNSRTNKPFLYLNRTTTLQFEGMSESESAGLLNYLYQHIEKPEFNTRVRWHTGSLVVWNNHQVLHYAVNDYKERRELHRVHFTAEQPSNYKN